MIAQSNGGRFDDEQVLHPESVELVRTSPADVDGDYAMGWWTDESSGHPTLEHNGVLGTAYAEQVLLPDTGHGIVLLANANHAFTEVPRIKDGVVALLNGEAPSSGPVTHRRLAGLFVVLILFGLLVRARGFLRRDSWARRSLRRPAWLRWLGIARLFLPAVLLVGLPSLMATLAGRVFPHRMLLLAAPELVIWLGVATVTGAALAGARALALRRA
ncbi:hypothetical protein ER308_08495 [Egibacter rhizosphaerae]|uniref:Beta-lactamase-related domain-containing protein n=1 Tax=Egibacter rhizosphaerae TaxID=1670831 RepID=A0A411YEE0_9ACTN|nr:hypothetical protein [Egibacter rhizosphaerae]QBI19585.1 hypothetical protein ER308_08495 [Egibacter rhizosphaerae]